MYGSQHRGEGGGGRGRGWYDRNPHPPPQPSPFTILRRENPMSLDMVEAAVAKAKSDLLAAGESVSTWKISQLAVISLQVSSWDSLKFRFNDVPTLRNLQFVEGKVNAFIHCFVSTRRMTSVHELGIELCQSEGVEQFDELGLGPLLRHPLVQHYFSIPPDATEVCTITVQDMIARLTVFQYRMKYKEFTVEEFLDFLVQKYSVASRENLGVRIQSMGMYIRFIRKIKKSEDATFKSIQESGLPREEPQLPSPSISEHFRALSSLIEEYAETEKDNKATATLGANNDDSGGQCSSRKGRKFRKQRRCPQNSPFLEVMDLIGMKLALFNTRICGRGSVGDKEKFDNQVVPTYEIIQIDPVKAQKLILTDHELEAFITLWKGACQKHSVDEVLAMMLHIYKKTDKQIRRMEKLFLSSPAVELLNIAVRFMKFGELSILTQDRTESISLNPIYTSAECIDEKPSTERDKASDTEKFVVTIKNNISSDDIIKQIVSYFRSDHPLGIQEQTVIHDCEIWVSKKFSVKDFYSLGHGSFSEFLERVTSLLPRELQCVLTGVFSSTSSLEASMHQQEFLTFLYQAARSIGSSAISGEYISMLLKKQFPAITLQLPCVKVEEAFAELIKTKSDFDIPRSITFSATLLGGEEIKAESSDIKYKSVGALGFVSDSDAIECLLSVPMLSDLRSWSHWDLVFAPSLGPLLEWLLSKGSIKDLSCILTSNGRIIRVEQSATLDEFFEASVQGSPFQAAIKLLSLYSVYGGAHNLPVALLKCYCQHAFDVTIKNYTDHSKANCNEETILDQSIKLHEDLPHINKAHALVAMFILECLGYLPSEFHSVAADILVSSLQFFTKDAALIMLSVCRTTDEHIVLHDIGLSLGIIEWIKDYQSSSSPSSGVLNIERECLTNLKSMLTTSNLFPADGNILANIEYDSMILDDHKTVVTNEDKSYKSAQFLDSFTSYDQKTEDAIRVIEKIRHEEFGLDPSLGNAESSLLKKQHARLGRALYCLSQELYSQDSHFILELVQNADDNIYPKDVEPTLIFILHAGGVVVMNNEQGFSEQNIRALCDVGSSTKKGTGAGYIGKKGIGFKSVFRVSDAPEIHSNGFHVKFDITDGQIGFVLPTVISPCISLFKDHVLCDYDQGDAPPVWNTCIVLPFNSKIKKNTGLSPIISMFSDLHPSLLLFLQQLRCIKFKNMLEGKLVSMKRVILNDGIVRVSHGNANMCWLVVDKYIQASLIRPDVQMTKIAIAFTLQDSDNGDYVPDLNQQPVFAFLPLRNYGLKFILHGDFILPSSREEVDGDSAWNQWLLSEFPDLFVNAEKSFCTLPCYEERPGKAVTAFMSFVPLIGEVHGFFSRLPHMILSKLRLSNCLLLDGSIDKWVPPSRVLQNWNEQIREFLPETLLQQHLGIGYLSKDIILPDSLAKALGIQEYGPKFLIEILSSICHSSDGIKVLGLDWLSSWLNALHISFRSFSVQSSSLEVDLLNCLRQISFIPLSDGSYGSLSKGPIWLPFDVFGRKFGRESSWGSFPGIYSRLCTVNLFLFSAETSKPDSIEEDRVDNLIRMLSKIGVQKLSSHDVIMKHILPSICVETATTEDASMMIEYLSFIMIHFQSSCSNCDTDRNSIIFELRKRSVILTNHGYKCPTEEPIHFGEEFGNSINVKELTDNAGIKWNEVDRIYLKHPTMLSLSNRLSNWREFFHILGVTDFVQVVKVERNVLEVLYPGSKTISCGDVFPSALSVEDWESPELEQLLFALSSRKRSEKCKYLLEVLDKLWDKVFSSKAKCYIPFQSDEETTLFESSFLKTIHKFKWVASSIGDDVHHPVDLFHDCESVRSIMGGLCPYAVPKVTSKKFLEDIKFKVHITLDDALRVIQNWKYSESPASISQMSKFYTFIRDELALSREKITEVRSSISIFIPVVHTSNEIDALDGIFMPPDKVFWHDPTGCLDRLEETCDADNPTSENKYPPFTSLAKLYPGLHDFLVTDCGVLETVPGCLYLKILLRLSQHNSPSQTAHQVFQVFLKWADDLQSGLDNSGEILSLKESLLKLENTVLPTVQGKWVSLHPQFGLVCWSDDDDLMEQCTHLSDVYFLQFGELTALEKEMLSGKVAALMQNIGIRALTDVLVKEAIYYGICDNTEATSLIDWVIPYVQRYLYKFHHDVYLHLKQHGFEELVKLQIISVEKLFYRYSLNGYSTTNSKRYECSCLLQGNIFYSTPNTDTHSFYLEISRFYFNGAPELQMANFLHMITNMAELGSTVEQIEFFIANSQKMPMLPEEEPIWTYSYQHTVNTSENISATYSFPGISKQKYPNSNKKHFNKTNWPPTNWKTAPNFNSSSIIQTIAHEEPGTAINQECGSVQTEAADKYFTENDSKTTVLESQKSELELIGPNCFDEKDASSSEDTFTERDKLSYRVPGEDHSPQTGRLGEKIAYRYFTEKFGLEAEVRWVNEEVESGLPYDLIIGKEEVTEYVEVKSTRTATKDWFPISTKEFDYASEKGESYSIARVILSRPTKPEIIVYKNPVELCRMKLLQLALLVPEKSEKSTV